MTDQRRKQLLLIGGLVVMLVALLAVSPAAWATPGQDRLRQTIPTPIPGDYSIVLPPQQDGRDYSFDFRLLPEVDCPPPAGCELYSPFTLDAFLGTELIYPVRFNPPLEICYEYSPAEAAAMGGAENLMLAYWDDDREAWVPLDNPRIDKSLRMVCGDIAFLPATACGLAVTCAISPTGVPITGLTEGPSSPAGTLLVVVLALGAALALAAIVRHGRAARGS